MLGLVADESEMLLDTALVDPMLLAASWAMDEERMLLAA